VTAGVKYSIACYWIFRNCSRLTKPTQPTMKTQPTTIVWSAVLHGVCRKLVNLFVL